MHRRRRTGRVSLPLILAVTAAGCLAGTVSAHPPDAGCGPTPIASCGWGGGPRWGECGLPGWRGGWCGLGSGRVLETVAVSGVGCGGFFSGSVRSAVVGCPPWPVCWDPCGFGSFGWRRGGWWSGGCGWDPWVGPAWYGPWVCPTPAVIWPPIVVSPFGSYFSSWLPAGTVPVFGPAGVAPYLGLTARGPLATGFVPGIAAARRDDGRRLLAGLTNPAPAKATARSSNRVALQRAARLVAKGDDALRAAVADERRLADALDAYRRAVAVAPDLPDTFVRQAIALVAAGRDDDAAAALGRAVALDRRLGLAPLPAPAGRPADPVFGDRPAGSAPPVIARGRALLAEVLAAGARPADEPRGNWITTAWSKRFGEQPAALARR